MREIGLVIKRTFAATPEEVYEAWADGGEFAKWHGPVGFETVVRQYDVKIGGEYRVSMISPDGAESSLKGKFVVVEPPFKLKFTWQWVDNITSNPLGEETMVSIELRGVGDKTEMTFTHSGFASEESCKGHELGWGNSFEKLEKVLD